MKKHDLVAKARATTRRPQPSRLAPAADGLVACAWSECGKLFKPRRKWQRYHDGRCRFAAWAAEHPRANTDQ